MSIPIYLYQIWLLALFDSDMGMMPFPTSRLCLANNVEGMCSNHEVHSWQGEIVSASSSCRHVRQASRLLWSQKSTWRLLCGHCQHQLTSQCLCPAVCECLSHAGIFFQALPTCVSFLQQLTTQLWRQHSSLSGFFGGQASPAQQATAMHRSDGTHSMLEQGSMVQNSILTRTRMNTFLP